MTPGRRLALVAAVVAGLSVAGLLGLALALGGGGDADRPSLRVVVEDESAVVTVPSRPRPPAPVPAPRADRVVREVSATMTIVFFAAMRSRCVLMNHRFRA